MDGLSHRVAIGQRFGERIAAGDAVFQTSLAAHISGRPFTIVDDGRKDFSGVNRFMLMQVMKDQSWTDPRFFTLLQIQHAGWQLRENAKPVALQFLISTDKNGVSLEQPEVKKFYVFNATQIDGTQKVAAEKKLPSSHLLGALSNAGFEPGVKNFIPALQGWLESLQQNSSPAVDLASTPLRLALATSLIEAEISFPNTKIERSLDSDWAFQIKKNPLILFQCVKEAELLAAEVLSQVKLVAKETLVEHEVQQKRQAKGSTGMQKNESYSARVESLFAERVAVLAVPFSEKDKAKERGAIWYAKHQIWFVPKGQDIKKFEDWNPNQHFLGPVATEHVFLDSFSQAMSSIGLVVPSQIKADGKWHNVPVNTKKNLRNTSGAYLLSLGEEPKGMINNKDTGEQIQWTYDGDLLTPEMRARMRAEAMARAEIAEREVIKIQSDAAKHANEIFDAADNPVGHGYLQKKGIPPDGLRQVKGSILLNYPEFIGEEGRSIIRPTESYLLVPMRTASGVLRAVQAISEDGSVKSFMRGAQKKGLMMVLGAESFDSLCCDQTASCAALAYAEGLATGGSFCVATGIPTVVCFDAGNLEAVAAETASKVPVNKLPIFAVDNDQFYVESALGFLSSRLGINPHSGAGSVLDVMSGAKSSRLVSLGDAIADGEWHQAPKGKYKMVLNREADSTEVRSVHIEIVPENGERKMSTTFSNRGIEAGRKAISSFFEKNERSLASMVIPEFKSLSERPTDWNDLHQIEGVAAIRTILHPLEQQLKQMRAHGPVDKKQGLEKSKSPSLVR